MFFQLAEEVPVKDVRLSILIGLEPFNIPTKVYLDMPKPTTEEPIGLTNRLHMNLDQLTPELLDALCNQFRQDVFEFAGKIDPKYLEYVLND